MSEHNYIFGPVPSRRLGLSLGIDLIPYKVCSFDCIYCQIGETTTNSLERRSFCDYNLVLKQLRNKLETGVKVDYITMSGSGEPTLSADIGKVIKAVKEMTSIPVAVLTNSSLLYLPDVQRDLSCADLLVPSMDAVVLSDFNKINRPNAGLDMEKILQGLKDLRKWFKGEIRLEIMFVKGVNDSMAHVDKMISLVRDIAPDKIELNTVIRPPSLSDVKAVDEIFLNDVAKRFGSLATVITSFSGVSAAAGETESVIIEALLRRPLTLDDLQSVTGNPTDKLKNIMNNLVERNKIKRKCHAGKTYYSV